MSSHLTERERYSAFSFFKIGMVVSIIIAVGSTFVYYALGKYYGVDWSLMKCLFMVVITMTTIGYGDWLNIDGKPLAEIYTMLLAIVGIGVPAFIISNVTALIVSGILGDTLRRRRMQQEIAALKDHVVVCGAGHIGEHCIAELLKVGHKFVVIDHSLDRLKDLTEDLGQFPYVIGEAGNDLTLTEAGVERASGLISTLTDDKDNLFVTLSARVLNPEIRIVSKAVDDHVSKKMMIAGASSTVSPSAIGGLRLVSELLRPATVGFLDSMLREKTTVRFGELVVKKGSALAGRTLAAADLRQSADVLVVGARHPGVESFIYNPKADFMLEPDCVIVVLGQVTEVEKLRPLFKPR